MSFSVRCERCDLEWCGTGLSGVFAQPSNLLRPSFHGMLLEIARFNREAPRLLDEPRGETLTLAAWLERERFGAAFRGHYLVPMAASVWSSGPAAMETFPAATLVRFFLNHGFLGVTTQLPWRTVDGGSREYVKLLTAPFRDRVHLGSPVSRVRRDAHGVELVFADGGSQRFDGVVLAAHADEALAMLEEPTPDEARLLGAWSYSRNETLLHSDASLLPRRRGARASWNYHLEDCASPWSSATLHYWINRLQGLPPEADWIVSLNPRRRPAEGTVARTLLYTHPVYTRESVATQAELPSLNGRNRTWFAGAYFGYGFHEDGLSAGLAAAAALGAEPL